MRKIFLLQPRQSGKTERGIYEFQKDPNNTMFVTFNEHMVKYITNRTGYYGKNIVSSNGIRRKLHDIKPNTVILDEYLLYKNKDSVYQAIQESRVKTLFIFTSAGRFYHQDIFDFVKRHKPNNRYWGVCFKFGNNLSKDVEDEIHDLYYNFITDKSTTLIDMDLVKNDSSHLQRIMDVDQYKLEILNQYLISTQ